MKYYMRLVEFCEECPDCNTNKHGIKVCSKVNNKLIEWPSQYNVDTKPIPVWCPLADCKGI